MNAPKMSIVMGLLAAGLAAGIAVYIGTEYKQGPGPADTGSYSAEECCLEGCGECAEPNLEGTSNQERRRTTNYLIFGGLVMLLVTAIAVKVGIKAVRR